MGVVLWKVKFEKELPSFAHIQSQFYSQTGLRLELKASLQLRVLQSSYAEISQLIQQDTPSVTKLDEERKAFERAHPGQYEKWAHFRDETKKKLNQFSYVTGVKLDIEGFYEVDFWVNENVIELESCVNEKKYGITSLVKALIDLGGRFDDLAQIYPEEWKQLKKWHEYKWYNRPKK